MKQHKQISFFSSTITTLFALLIIAVHANAQEQITLTWADAINRVLANNQNLASSSANLEASRFNIAIARANTLPGLSFGGSVSQSKNPTFSESSGVIPASSVIAGGSLSQMIYNEKYLANLKIQKYLLASQEEQYRNTSYNTISAAGMSYISSLFAIDLLEVQKENLGITEQNLQGARDRQEVGSTNKQEVLRWETKMYADQQSVASQKAAVLVSQGNFNHLLNVPLETKVNLEELTLDNNGFIFSSEVVLAVINNENSARVIRDYLVELGLANSPVLAGINQQLQAQNRQLQSDKRWAIPSFDATAGAKTKFDLKNPDSEAASGNKGFWKYGLSMSWPLIDGGANISKAKQSKWQLSSLELSKNDIQSSLEQSIRASVAVVISDFINIGLAKLQSNAAQMNYDLVHEAYIQGESSLLDLLDAQNQKLGADISSRIALYTFFDSLLTVEQAIGYFPFLEPEENVQTIITELEQQLLISK